MVVWTVTANRLADGAVMYLRADQLWSGGLDEAWTADEKEVAESRLGWAREQQHVVCDPYVLPLRREGGRVEPVSARERIRAEGPAPTLGRLGHAVLAERNHEAG